MRDSLRPSFPSRIGSWLVAMLAIWGCAFSGDTTDPDATARGAAPAREAETKTKPHIVFLIGEKEYRTAETLPAFAKKELEPRGARCTFVHVSENDPNNFPELKALEEADLLVVSVRRRTPPAAQLAAIRAYLARGGALVGIRTASHAFDRDPPAGHGRWATFDREVLGHHYQGHYGNKPPAGPKSIVRVAEAASDHPIVKGLSLEELVVPSHLYKARDLAKTATPLVFGRLENSDTREPVALVNTYEGGRVFYTSLGSPGDFELPFFRKLFTQGIYWALETPPKK